MNPMTTQACNTQNKFDNRLNLYYRKVGLILLLCCIGFASFVMAGGDPIRDIHPGKNTFADAIRSNPGLKYKIESKLAVQNIDGEYRTFVRRLLQFKGLGITLVSQERPGKKFRLGNAKTQIESVRIDKPAKVFRMMQEMLPELSKIPFPDESLETVEKALGEATLKTSKSLDYDELGFRFYFFASKRSKTMNRIRLLHWSASEKATTSN